MKRLFVLLLVSAMVLGLTGCGTTAQEAAQGTSAASETIHLTLGTYGSGNYPAVKAFNESQTDYYIDIVDYSGNYALERDAARTQLSADLAAGDGPDIIDLWKMRMDPLVYARNGYLEGLYSYLDADETLSREDLVPSFCQASEVDGELYVTLSGFALLTVLGVPEVVGDQASWNLERLIDLWQEYGEETMTTSGSAFLYNALQFSLWDYLDQDTGDFDTENYGVLLEFCKSIDQTPETDTVPLLSTVGLGTFNELQYYEALWGGQVAVYGFPGQSQGQNTFALGDNEFAMNANSSQKAGAWSFLRTFFTEEYQYDTYVDSAYHLFPANIHALDLAAQEAMEPVYYQDENGNTVENTQRGEQDGFEYHAATQSQVNQVLEAINQTSRIASVDYDLMNLAIDEATGYLQDDQPLDQILRTTQSVLTTYWSEL
jgi:ABC-type glycerol-3-phosphate transport system substrate-binding protein